MYYCEDCDKQNMGTLFNSYNDMLKEGIINESTDMTYMLGENGIRASFVNGYYFNNEVEKNNKTCPHCGNKNLKYIDMDMDEVFLIGEVYDWNKGILADHIHILENSKSDFIQRLEIARNIKNKLTQISKPQPQKYPSPPVVREKKEEPIVSKHEDDVVRCPKCGSTNIQVVHRKWSFFRGFATNKLDRVCVKCMYKF